MTGLAGHRIEALEAIKKAASIHPSLELRNEAIAALTLVDLKVAKLLNVRENSGQRLAFDKSLETVAVATGQGDINIISLSDGRIQKTLTGVGLPILSLIHSGSRYLAARCADDAVYVFECATGRQIARLPGHPLPPQLPQTSDCVFSPDETLLALGSRESLEIVEVATGKEIARLKTIPPEQSAFSSDSRLLVFGNPKEKTAGIWRFADQDSVTSIPLPAEPSSFAWSVDDKTLAVGCADSSIQVFRTSDHQCIGSLQGHRQTVSKIAFNHRGDMLVSNASDLTLRLWDLRTMTQLVEQTGYWSESAIGFSPDDQAIGTTDGKSSAILVELVGLRRVCTAFAPPSAKEKLVTGSTLDYSPDSRLLALASSTSIRILDAKKGQTLLTLPIPTPTQTTVRFLADGQTLAVVARRTGITLHRFVYQDGNFKLTGSDSLAQHLSYVIGSAPYDFSPYLCLTSEKEDRGLIWDASTARTLSSLDASPNIHDMALSPDKKWLVTTYTDRPTQICAFPSGRKITELSGGQEGNVNFSPSGRWLGSTGKIEQILWNTKDWSKGPTLPPQVEEKTGAFAFSFDENYFAARMRDQTALVSLPAGELLAMLEQRILPNLYSHLRFSPDGSQLASQGMDNSLILWDLVALQSELRAINLSWKID